jgi:hypothetical protein
MARSEPASAAWATPGLVYICSHAQAREIAHIGAGPDEDSWKDEFLDKTIKTRHGARRYSSSAIAAGTAATASTGSSVNPGV